MARRRSAPWPRRWVGRGRLVETPFAPGAISEFASLMGCDGAFKRLIHPVERILPMNRMRFQSARPALSAPSSPPSPSPTITPTGSDPVSDPVLSPDMTAYVAERLDAATAPGEAAGGLDIEALEAEYAAEGRLTDDTFAQLEAAGIPRGVVLKYIEGQQAVAEKLLAEAHRLAGGPKRFEAVQAWAETALPAAEHAAYQAALAAGPEQAKFAVRGLVAAFDEAHGAAPRLTRGEAAPTSDGLFASAAEVSQAIRDPRYKKDPAYRARVAQKLARSKVF